MLGEPVSLVANGLGELEAWVLAAELDGLGALLHVDQLLLLGKADHHGRLHVELLERLEGCMQLAEPAVDEDHVRIQLVALAGLGTPRGDVAAMVPGDLVRYRRGGEFARPSGAA